MAKISQGENGCPQGIHAVFNGFLNGSPVGKTLVEVRKCDQKSAAFIGCHRSDLKRVFLRLIHGSSPFHKLDELLYVNRLNRSVSWNHQHLTVSSNKGAVTASIVTPDNAVLLRHRLQLADLPVNRIVPHRGQKFGSRIHDATDTTFDTTNQETLDARSKKLPPLLPELEHLHNHPRRSPAPDIFGGFFMPATRFGASLAAFLFASLRGQLGCPGRKPKSSRPNLGWGVQPPETRHLEPCTAPAISIASQGAHA